MFKTTKNGTAVQHNNNNNNNINKTSNSNSNSNNSNGNNIINRRMKKTSDTMMEVLITFPLRCFDIDLTILEEFMLIIYQPTNINDDRFDKVDDYEENDPDYMNKPLVFTQKSTTNHVILDGIHEISFRLELPKGPYVYLHKQRDRLLLNEKDKVTTLGGGRRVNYFTSVDGELIFPQGASPQTLSPRGNDTFYEKKQLISHTTTPKQKDSINQILNNIHTSIIQKPPQGGKGGEV